jgi:hypothetical protein
VKALSLLTVASVILSAGIAQAGHFMCDNAPATKWATYFCVSGNYNNAQELFDVEFGTCEGSARDQEAEPVDIFPFAVLKHDASRAASSAQWKQASAFNVSTQELGENVMYIQKQSFAGGADQVVRLKGSAGDTKLRCTFE